MSIVGSNALAGASGQAAGGGGGGSDQINRSVRLNSADSAYFSRTPSTAGNRKTWTWSGWVKRSGLGAYDFLFMAQTSSVLKSSLSFWNADYIRFKGDYNDGTARNFSVITNALFRDPSAWYHVVCRLDTTQATAADRIKIWVNGVEQTFSSATYPTQNSDIEFNNTSEHLVGSQTSAPQNGLDGYLAEVHFVDGTALAATDFGEYDSNNVWQPKVFAGSYNSSGFIPGANITYGSWADVFNGSTTGHAFTYSTATSTATLSPGIAWSSKFRIYGLQYPGSYVKINGGSALTGFSTTVGWVDVTSQVGSSGVLSSVEISDDNYNYFRIQAIELDDTILDLSQAGVNGFHLNFSDNSSNTALGTDSSGNSNTWTVNNIIASGSLVTDGNDYQGGWAGPSAYWASTDSWSNLTVQSDTQPLAKHKWDTAETLSSGHTFATGDFRQAPANGSGGFVLRANTTVTLKFEAFNHITEIAVTDTDAQTWGNRTIVATNPSQGDFVTATGKCFWWSTTSAFPNVGGMGTVYDSDAADIDSLIDTPSNYTASSGNNGGNYATMNPLNNGSATTISNGNLDVSVTSSGGTKCQTTIGMSSGKYYCEFTCGSGSFNPGLANADTDPSSAFLGDDAGSWTYGSNGLKYHNDPSATSGASYGATYAAGDVIGVAFDADNGTLTYYKNGTSQGTAYSGLTSGPYFFATGGSSSSYNANFGQRPFAYTPPTGYVSLCTQNLPDPTIADGSAYMDVKTYTGDGTTTQSVSGLSFSPDLVWLKSMSATHHHVLFDTIRGTLKRLISSLTNAESEDVSSLTAFNSDGFSFKNGNELGASNTTYVAWTWDGGTSNTSISAGSLNSSAYNQNDVWSDDFSATRSAYPATNAFDGSITTYAHAADSAGSVTWTPATALSYNSLVRVYALKPYGGVNSYVSLNGGTGVLVPSSGTGSGNWATVATGSGSITSISSQYDNTYRAGIYAIEVDGKILVDTGVTPPNVPSVASTVRANASSGFSIVSYTGSGSNETVGHGLNAAPGLVIIKNRDTTAQWAVGHQGLSYTSDEYLVLNSTAGKNNGAVVFNSSAPTSSFINVGTAAATNGNTNDMIAYCFAPVEGYSSFGSYTGNGNASGPFVHTGFRPRWLLIKLSSGASDWRLFDTARSSFNTADKLLFPSSAEVEATNSTYSCDILSNGFKMRNTHAGLNANGSTYIYAAFAEHPQKTARAR